MVAFRQPFPTAAIPPAPVSTQLVGGLLDGAEIAPHSEGFIYVVPPPDPPPPVPGQVREKAAKPRVYTVPYPGRLLYRHTGEVYVFAGFTHGPCQDCGALNDVSHRERSTTCDLCGGVVRRVPVRAR